MERVILMFKVLMLQALCNLSNEQAEYQILYRLSFMKFLGLEMHDKVPDARTIWLFREHLFKAAAVENLFAKFDAMRNAAGFEASGGQIVDATFVEPRLQHLPLRLSDAQFFGPFSGDAALGCPVKPKVRLAQGNRIRI